MKVLSVVYKFIREKISLIIAEQQQRGNVIYEQLWIKVQPDKTLIKAFFEYSCAFDRSIKAAIN